MTSPWKDNDAPKSEGELREFSAGECEHVIRERFAWLVRSGYRASAMLLIEELIREHKLDRLVQIKRLEAAE